VPVSVLFAVVLLTCALPVGGQQPSASSNPQDGSQTVPSPQSSTLDDTLEAGAADDEEPARKLVSWNEYDGKFFTIRVGGGVLYEYAAYSQDGASKNQFALHPMDKIRDARFSLKGRFEFKRPVSWTCGILYNGPTDEFLIRECGIMVAVPEAWGHIFVGRTKEGFSLNKVMIGYAGWTQERATISDATIPIFGDGVKWLGYLPEVNLLWNLAFLGDWTSEYETWSTYDHQIVGRIAWVPFVSDREGTLLHIGMSLRSGKPDEDMHQVRSRPEAFPAPYFIDTGSFPAKNTRMTEFEAYYRPGPLLVGGEYFLQKVDAPERGDPFFHGGDVFVSWMATGETRVYNTRGGYFNQISPARPVFEGGPGAWEIVARFSYVDLDGGPLAGGKFWRFTPMVNWHLSDNVRLALTYGYGSLDRFDLVGKTHFFQTRLQLLF
jgi:phosphate-selective porin OprO/OprP